MVRSPLPRIALAIRFHFFYISLLLLPSASSPANGAPFSFSVTCDMRQYAGPNYDDPDYFRGVCEAIGNFGAGAFMISPGDIDPPQNVRWTIDQYLGEGYLWYPVVGNHEAETLSDMEYLRNYNYDANGAAEPNIVNTGPPNGVETTFSFDHENVHFVVLNQYYDGFSDFGTDGDVVDALYDWLAADLSTTSKEHIFVIGHEPAYPQPDEDNTRRRHIGDSLDQYPDNRDRFLNLLREYGVIAYFCGHTHGYSAFYLDGIWQLDAGNCMGQGDTGAPSTFFIVDVDGEEITLHAYRDRHDGGYDYDDLVHHVVLTDVAHHRFAPLGSEWRYLDDGSDQGALWRDPLFDDSPWSSGPAPLGYGEGDEATVVGYGADPSNKYITTYFRKTFQVADPSAYSALRLGLLRDDGGIVYLNGVEVFRDNMPDPDDGEVDYLTGASWSVGGGEEDDFFGKGIDPDLLVEGENVLAVEIHQIHGSSSDLGFDLELTGLAQDHIPYGNVAGHVWNDSNGNGLWEAGEGGMAGVGVNLIGQRGEKVAGLTSDANGAYFFDNVVPYFYAVEFSAPDGYRFTPARPGSETHTDSDIDPRTGRTQIFAIRSWQTVSSVDAGLFDELRRETEDATMVRDGAPARNALLPNRPNPFNARTEIRFDLEAGGQVTLAVHDLQGNRVRELLREERGAGSHSVSWDGKDQRGHDVASGVYFLFIRAGSFSTQQKMVLLR